MPELTPKERIFIRSYLGDSRFNATDAARRAGYRWPGKQGSQIARRPRVKAEIERGFEAMRPASAR